MSARIPICTVCGREVPADVLGDLAAAGDAPQLDFLTCGNQECIDVLDQEERSAARETKARDARSRAERRWREFERFVGAPIRDLNDDESFRELRDVARPIIRSRSPAGKVVTKKQLADFALSCVEPAVAALATAEDRERIALWVREGDVSHHAVRLSGFDLVALLDGRKSVMRSPMAPQPDPYVPGENVHSPSHPTFMPVDGERDDKGILRAASTRLTWEPSGDAMVCVVPGRGRAKDFMRARVRQYATRGVEITEAKR